MNYFIRPRNGSFCFTFMPTSGGARYWPSSDLSIAFISRREKRGLERDLDPMAIVAGVDFGTLRVRVSLVDSDRGVLAPQLPSYKEDVGRGDGD
jgi:hypothetical protein